MGFRDWPVLVHPLSYIQQEASVDWHGQFSLSLPREVNRPSTQVNKCIDICSESG
jgi:hypothetical protein